MFAGEIDLVGRDIRADMAFLAGVGLAGHLDGKAVPGMAGRAGPPAAIQIDAADPLVGPAGDDGKFHFTGVRVPHLGFDDLEDGAVAVVTGIGLGIRIFGGNFELAVFQRRCPQDGALELLVNRIVSEIGVGMGHDVARVLVGLGGVAGAAVVRTDHHMHVVAVVLERVGMGIRPQGMAFGAAHGHALQGFRHIGTGHLAGRIRDRHGRLGGNGRMASGAPALHDAWVKNGMAIKAFLGSLTYRGFLAPAGADHQRPHNGGHRNPTVRQVGLLFVRGV